MMKITQRTNRNNRIVKERERHYHPKVSKNRYGQIVDLDTRPLVFDMPELEGQEIDGQIVIKMDGRIVDGFQIQQWMETTYRECEAAWRIDQLDQLQRV